MCFSFLQAATEVRGICRFGCQLFRIFVLELQVLVVSGELSAAVSLGQLVLFVFSYGRSHHLTEMRCPIQGSQICEQRKPSRIFANDKLPTLECDQSQFPIA